MFKKFLKFFLPLSFVLTFASFGIYGAVQQSLRQSANSPQIQMSEDTASQISTGSDPAKIIPTNKVDVAKSLAPFLIVFDANGKVLASSGEINGATPSLPTGVFDYVRRRGEDRVTWQTKDGTRIAAVINNFSGKNPGFVLAGRNLREVERTEDNIFKLILVGYLASLGVAFVLSFVLQRLDRI